MVPETDNVGPYAGGWICNACRKHGAANEANWRHVEKTYDLCDACYEKIQNLNEEPAGDPPMFVLDFKGRKFYKAVEGKTACTKENIEALINGAKDGSIAAGTLKM